MERAFAADFSEVRVHVGPQAAAIGALAFTAGTDIFFAQGRYQPQTTEGLRLLGHELAHVVQQKQGRVRNPLGHGTAIVRDQVLEAEADRMGTRLALEAPARQLPRRKPAGRSCPPARQRQVAFRDPRRGPVQRAEEEDPFSGLPKTSSGINLAETRVGRSLTTGFLDTFADIGSGMELLAGATGLLGSERQIEIKKQWRDKIDYVGRLHRENRYREAGESAANAVIAHWNHRFGELDDEGKKRLFAERGVSKILEMAGSNVAISAITYSVTAPLASKAAKSILGQYAENQLKFLATKTALRHFVLGPLVGSLLVPVSFSGVFQRWQQDELAVQTQYPHVYSALGPHQAIAPIVYPLVKEIDRIKEQCEKEALTIE
jgi:hypothetical protein